MIFVSSAASEGVSSPSATACTMAAAATAASAAVVIVGAVNGTGLSFRGGAIRSIQSRSAVRSRPDPTGSPCGSAPRPHHPEGLRLPARPCDVRPWVDRHCPAETDQRYLAEKGARAFSPRCYGEFSSNKAVQEVNSFRYLRRRWPPGGCSLCCWCLPIE